MNAAVFGHFAVALSVSTLFSLFATGGLGQIVGRTAGLPPSKLGALVVFSLVLGLVAGATQLFTAGLAASIWNANGSGPYIAILSFSTFLLPVTTFATGYVRRQGAFRALSILMVLANVSGMLAGSVLILLTNDPLALIVSPVLGQFLTLVFVIILQRRTEIKFGKYSDIKDDLAYSWKIVLTTIVAYLNGNLSAWLISRFFGSSIVGQWNRADALAYSPFIQLQAALTRAVYPEFRHDHSSTTRAYRVWTDLLGMVAMAVWPIGALLSAVAPFASNIIFGPGWAIASWLVTPLALIGTFQISLGVLSSAFDSLGKIRWIWFFQLASLFTMVLGAIFALLFSEWRVLVFAIGASLIVTHSMQLAILSKKGFLNLSRVLSFYLRAILSGGLTFAVSLGFIQAFKHNNPIEITLMSTVLIGTIGHAVLRRRKHPLWVLLKKYGFSNLR